MKHNQKIEKFLNETLDELVKIKLCDSFKKYKDVVIVGDKSHIDSIGFVTLFAYFQAKIDKKMGKKLKLNTEQLFKYCKNKKKITYKDFLNFANYHHSK